MQTSKTMQIGLLIVALIMPYAFQAFFGAVFLFIGVLPDLLQGKPFDPHAIEHMPTMLGLALICSNLSLYFFFRLTQMSRHPLIDRRRKIITGANDRGARWFHQRHLCRYVPADSF